MPANINSVTVTGNLTQDPELKTVGEGFAICNLRIAVNGREKKGDQWQERADFFDITVFGGQGENCAKFLEKGKPIAVSGRLKQERWETDDGKRSRVVIIARDVQFLPSRERGESGSDNSGEWGDPKGEPAGMVGKDDDIPF